MDQPNIIPNPSLNHAFIDGKIFIIGEKKISMWKKAKCNQEKKIEKKINNNK